MADVTDKLLGYRINEKSGKFHLFERRQETTWKVMGLWPSVRIYTLVLSIFDSRESARERMKAIIEDKNVIVNSDDYTLKGDLTNINY